MAFAPGMKEPSQIDPEVAKKLLSVYADDPEVAAILKQMEMANALRGKMIGESKNAFGALAQGLEGYQAGAADKELRTKIGDLGTRVKEGRGTWWDALFGSPDKETPDLSGGVKYPEQGFE
jgi:hypothetical protein